MPAKKTQITDAERTKRLKEAARELGTNNDPDALERAFRKVAKRGKPLSQRGAKET